MRKRALRSALAHRSHDMFLPFSHSSSCHPRETEISLGQYLPNRLAQRNWHEIGFPVVLPSEIGKLQTPNPTLELYPKPPAVFRAACCLPHFTEHYRPVSPFQGYISTAQAYTLHPTRYTIPTLYTLHPKVVNPWFVPRRRLEGNSKTAQLLPCLLPPTGSPTPISLRFWV